MGKVNFSLILLHVSWSRSIWYKNFDLWLFAFGLFCFLPSKLLYWTRARANSWKSCIIYGMTQYFTCLVTNTLSPIYLRPTGQQQRLSLELPRFYIFFLDLCLIGKWERIWKNNKTMKKIYWSRCCGCCNEKLCDIKQRFIL